MNLFKKVKNLFSKKKKPPEPSLIDIIIDRLQKEQNILEKKPEELSKEEWKSILRKMSSAFKIKRRKLGLKSLARQKQEEVKYQKGLELFKIYFLVGSNFNF